MTKWYRGFRPIHPWGWAVYVFALAILVWGLRAIDSVSESGGDLAFNYFPFAAGVFLVAAFIIKARRE